MVGSFNILGDIGGKVVSLLKVDPGILLGLLSGIVLVALLLLAYRGLLRLRDKSQGLPFFEKIKSAMARTPASVADPAKRARLDDLRKKYDEGVEKFRQAGKDLYSIPWYMLVGPAGSGKTEAMRHCKVGFPPGLQDCFQGAGGTLNMHWWFTNHAVVLDTAGRIFMEESALQGGSEWREFLKLLKQSRPHAPINGMLLVIGVDSLIKDSADQIETKAEHIAKQLDTIQRTLDVRFPVYVVLTKCDLITGFKEFFDKIDDPQLQHQILGWSNPAPLDEPFRAEAVDDHFHAIRARLLKRRATLLLDPVHTEDPQARRTDQVDELFALPDNITKIAPRLRRYLEIIFQAGEWSPKPLFLRGMYFTSSMRQGKALDEDLAAALGVSIDAIPGGKVYDEERPYFLRDLFTAKIFREKGLVTRATNVHREQAGRRRLLLGSGVAVAAALLGMTLFSSAQLRRAVKDPLETWKQVSSGLNQAPVINIGASGTDTYFGAEPRIDAPGGQKITPLELIERARQQSDSPINMGFLSFGRVLADVNEKQRLAYTAVVHHAIAKPLYTRVRAQLTDRGVPWTPQATAALAELIAADTRARGAVPAIDTTATSLDAPAAMLAFLISGPNTAIPDADLRKIREALRTLPESSLVSYGLVGVDASLDDIRRAIERAQAAWERTSATSGDLGNLAAADEAVTAFAAALENAKSLASRRPTTRDQYAAFAAQYAKAVTDLETAATQSNLDTHAALWNRLADRTDRNLADHARADIVRQADLLASGLPKDIRAESQRHSDAAPAAETISAAITLAVDAATKDLPARAAAVRSSIATDAKRAVLERGRTANEHGYQAVIALFKSAAPAISPAEAPAADWLNVVDRIKAVSESTDAARTAVNDWTRAAPPRLQAQQFAQSVSSSIDIARGARVGAWIATYTAALDQSGRTVQDVVAAAAGAAPARPALALSALSASPAPGAGFSPSVAATVFRGWKAVRSEIAGAPWILIEPDTADRVSKLGHALSLYGREYADAWLATLDHTNVREFRTWTEFFAAYEETEAPEPVEVHATLKELHEQVRRDLLAIAEGIDAPEFRERAAAVERQLAKLNAASGEAVRERINAARSRLKLLGPDPRRARTQLLQLLAAGNFDVETLTGAFHDSVPEYWQSLVRRAVESLANEYQSLAREDLTRLRDLARFPLVADRTTKPLTTDELAAALRIANELQSVTADQIQIPARFASIRDPLLNLAQAQALRERPAAAEFLRKARVLGRLFTGEDGQSLIDSIARVNETRKPNLPGDNEPVRWVADQWIWRGVMTQPESTDAADGEPIRAPRAGEQDLSLVFINSAQGGAEIGRADFPGPWAGPALVLSPGAEPDGAGSRNGGLVETWRVPISIPVEANVQGVKKTINRFLWIRVTLKRGVPPKDDWPAARELDR